MQKVFVYDPTASDKLSSVRGIGRYLQILKENFSDEFNFINFTNFKNFTNLKDSVFINPFFNFLQPPPTLRRLAKKQIAVIHDLILLKYPSHFPAGIKGSIYTLLNKLALKNYDLIITDSEASKKDIIDILSLPDNKIRVVYPCLPNSFINPKSEIRNPKQFSNLKNSKFKIVSSFDIRASNFCLYVGDVTWNKNLVNLARAIKIADVNCVFVGKVFESLSEEAKIPFLRQSPGAPLGVRRSKKTVSSFSHFWQKELKEFYELTKGDKRFIFAGFIPDLELFKLYEQASVNLLLSRAEGFGFSYLEAANFSCPSLLSDISVFKEISAGNALFADPKNPTDIAEKIKEINSDKILRNKIGVDAKKRSEYFSLDKFKKEFLKILMS